MTDSTARSTPVTTTIQASINRARIAATSEDRARNLIEAARHLGGRSPVGWGEDDDPFTAHEYDYLIAAMECDDRRWRARGGATEGAAVCPGCGCLWDDHRTLAAWLESDDPLEVAQRCSPDFTGPIDLCGDCGACADERGP